MKAVFSRLKRWGIRTYQMEAAVAAIALALIAVFSGNQWKEWLGAVAVFFTFQHCQITDRMRESQEKLTAPTVECYRLSNRYLLIKEFLWLTYFVLSHAWAALGGVVIFGGYPFWRKYYRAKIKPQSVG